MQLKIEEAIPIKAKMFSNNFIFMPKTIREALKWRAGDNLTIYATKQGIFIRKEG